jgi:tetratricopeptide (TPR) repeat protein
MRIEAYISKLGIDYSLTEDEKEKIYSYVKKRRIIATDFEPDDEYLRTLYEEAMRPVIQSFLIKNGRDPAGLGKVVIMTLPMNRFNASPVLLSPGSVAIICDCQTKALSMAISRLIAKSLSPVIKDENIMPFDMDADDPGKDIGKVKVLIDNDDYLEFKNAFLRFSGKIKNPCQNISKPGGFEAQMCDAFALFLLGHELAHFVNNHLIGYKKKEAKKERVSKRWDQEAEADMNGYEFMYPAMSARYSNVDHKAQFNMGVEMFFWCQRLYELWLLIGKHPDLDDTHSDSDRTRITELRTRMLKDVPAAAKDEENTSKEEQVSRDIEIGFRGYIQYTSEGLFDAYEKRISDEILISAAILGKRHISYSEFMDKLESILFNQDNKIRDLEIAGVNHWIEGRFTQALCSLAKDGYGPNFYYALAVLYRYKYEHYHTKMLLNMGQQEYHDGIKSLLEDHDPYSAAGYFQEALDEDPEDAIAAFALGLAFSEIGFDCLFAGDFENAVNYFTKDIKTSPVALESFNGRRAAYYLEGHKNDAFADDKICTIISLAPGILTRAEKYRDELDRSK